METKKPLFLKLTEDHSLNLISDNEFPGIIYAKIELYSKKPSPRIKIS